MHTQTNALEDLFNKAIACLETKGALLKLKAVSKTSDIAASVFSRLVIGLFAAMVLFFLNIAVALWLGNKMGAAFYGFFVVAGFYLLLLLICLACRRRYIKQPLRDVLVKKMLN
jgi:hypothetical protein